MNKKRISLSQSGLQPLVWSFDVAEFDETRFELRVGGRAVALETKPLEVLLLLLRNAGETVSKAELFEQIWPHHGGSPDPSLTNAIGKLRQALSDDEQSIIRTQHGIGYRLAVPVMTREAPPRTDIPLSLKTGDLVRGREHWRLERLLGQARGNVVWLAEHVKTHEQRVFKFCTEASRLGALRREATLFRVLNESLDCPEKLVRILDWNLSEPPFHLECEYGGESLDRWVEGAGGFAGMSITARIELAVKIADAAALAHSVGVLHKDLKPSNVLISRDDHDSLRVRLTDFGSGRLAEPERLHELGITEMGLDGTRPISADSNSGTLAYLAPELLKRQPATTQSDVYSLGIMLYQIMVGDFSRPLTAGWEAQIEDELLRQDIADAAQGDPSRRMSSAAELARRLRDLPRRREQLAQDREQSRRHAAAQEALKTANARRPWLISTIAVLVTGLFVSTLLYVQALRSEREAIEQVRITRSVNEFLNQGLLGSADPYQSGSSALSVREAVDRAAGLVDQRFASQPIVAAAVHSTLGRVYNTLGVFDKAEHHFTRAWHLYREHRGADDRHALASALALAEVLARASKPQAAAELLASIQDVRHTAGRDDPVSQALSALAAGVALGMAHRYVDAQPRFSLAVQLLDEQIRRDPSSAEEYRDLLLTARKGEGLALMKTGQLEEAEKRQRALIEETTRRLGPNHPQVHDLRLNLGMNLVAQKRFDEARQLLAALLPDLKESLGETHPVTIQAISELGNLHEEQRQFPEAQRLYVEVYQNYEKQFGDQHQLTIIALHDIASIQKRLGLLQEASRNFERAYKNAEKALGLDQPITQAIAYDLASIWLDLEEADDAERILNGLDAELLKTALPQYSWDARLAYQAARAHRQKGQTDRSRSEAEKAYQLLTGSAAAAAPGQASLDELLTVLEARL